MRVVRYRAADGLAWGLLDSERQEVRHVAGSFAAWAPRVANGEGLDVLPATGRRHALATVELVAPLEETATLFEEEAPSEAEVDVAQGEKVMTAWPATRRLGVPLGLALIGAPLVGRQNPLRCVFGYAAATRWIGTEGEARGPLSIIPEVRARHRFGDQSPDFAPLWAAKFGGLLQDAFFPRHSLAERLRRLDAHVRLRPGDAVLLRLSAVNLPDLARAVSEPAARPNPPGRVFSAAPYPCIGMEILF